MRAVSPARLITPGRHEYGGHNQRNCSGIHSPRPRFEMLYGGLIWLAWLSD